MVNISQLIKGKDMCNLELGEINFKTLNGVKHEGVLSAVLSSMYIDPLLVELRYNLPGKPMKYSIKGKIIIV